MNESATAVDVARAATLLLTPAVRARPSTLVWDERFEVAGALGPIAVWSAGAGPIVLLAHGWEATHTDLDAFVAPLLARGRRVVAFDLPAHGDSAGETASIPDCAEALLAVAASAGPPQAAIGHSMGGGILTVALERGLALERIALVSPPERFRHAVDALAAHFGLDAEAIAAELLARGLDVDLLDLPRSAAAFAMPMLAVHSADDRLTRIGGTRRTVAAWRGATMLEVDGLGHSRLLRDAAVVEAVTAFVTATSQASPIT